MADCRAGPETLARIAGVWQKLLDDVAAGDAVKDACAAAGVSRGQLRAYLREVPGARAEWDDAREESADAYFDELREVTYYPGIDAAAARVKQQGLMWMAAKRCPRRYSDKAQLDVNVRTIDLTRIITDAQARLAAAQVGRIVQHSAPMLQGNNAAVSDSDR